MHLKEKVKDSVTYILQHLDSEAKIAIVLGSGLGGFAETLAHPFFIHSADIPHYPGSTVLGHKGRWAIGDIDGTHLICIQGRVHFYEGYPLSQVTYYVHLLAALGVQYLIITTACGGLNPEFSAGDLMLITDQINFTFTNPLIGHPENILGRRFPDMVGAYDQNLIATAEQVGIESGFPFRKGVFCWVSGPNYETAAEVNALRKLGGDAVSMSTGPEVIVARQRHLKVLGVSLITNLSTGLSPGTLTHADVTETATQATEKFTLLLTETIKKIGLCNRTK